MRAGSVMWRSGVRDQEHKRRRADAKLGTVLDVAMADAFVAYERAVPAAQVAQHDPQPMTLDDGVTPGRVGVRNLQVRAAARAPDAEARLGERDRLPLALARESRHRDAFACGKAEE